MMADTTMPDTPFAYEKSSRRPMTWAALIATCGFLVVAWIYAAPWDILALWALAIIGLAYLVMKNPKYGIRLNDKTLTYWARGPEQAIALSDIDHVAFRPVTKSSYITVHLRSGRTCASSPTPSPHRPRHRSVHGPRRKDHPRVDGSDPLITISSASLPRGHTSHAMPSSSASCRDQ